MKILTKLMLANAVMVTSGFAGGVSEFQDGGTLEAGAKLEFESGGELTMNADKSLHVYGSVEGDGQISCQGSGKVFVYQGAYAEDSTNAEAIKDATSSTATTVHTYDADAGGSIDATVTVDPSDALVFVGPNLCEYASPLDNTNLVYVAIDKDGSSVRCTGETETTSEITCELANADAAISTLKPASLVVENKVKFSGNNAGFTSGTVTYGTLENPTETEIASQDAFFPVESVVERGSKLSLTAAAGTTISKNLTVNGCNKWSLNDAEDEVLTNDTVGVLSVTGPVVVTNGACLKIQGKTAEPICEYPKAYPLVKSWPEGSFSGQLMNPKYKRYYEFENMSVQGEFNVSGCVSVNEMTGEAKIESGMISPEEVDWNPLLTAVYSFTQASVSDGNLILSYYYNFSGPDLGTGTAFQLNVDSASLNSYASATFLPELLSADDGMFSLGPSESGYYNRLISNMFIQPGSLDLSNVSNGTSYLYVGETLSDGTVDYFVSVRKSADYGLQMVLGEIQTNYLNIYEDKSLLLNPCDCEGSYENGYFLNYDFNNFDGLMQKIDACARTHTFEETWMTLEDYNEKYGTNYTFTW